MGVLDRARPWKGDGVPGWAVVVVNRGAANPEETSSLVTIVARAEPDGPEGTVRSVAKRHQAELITHGMRIPVLLDRATGEPRGLRADGLDEAIGRYYQEREPERYASWSDARADKRRGTWRDAFSIGPNLGDVGGALRDLPGGLRSMVREIRGALRSDTDQATGRVKRAAQVVEVEQDGPVHVVQLLVMDGAPGRPVTVRQELGAARAAQLLQQPWVEVMVDPAHPDDVTL